MKRANQRLRRFINSFDTWNIDAFFVSCEPNVSFLSGYEGTESFLLITRKESYFLTDFRYLEQAARETRGFKILLRDTQSYPAMVSGVCSKLGISRLGFEGFRISYYLQRALSRSLKDTALVPVPQAIEKFRIRKEPGEIKKIRKSIEISRLGMLNLEASLAPGMREREILARLEYDTKMLGAQKPAFDIIIAADPNSSMPHAITGDTQVQESDMVLVDMGVVVEGYHCDLTRCFFVGKIPPLKQKVYDVVRKAQELGIRKARPGVRACEVDQAARDYIHRKGYGKYFGHGTGHGVGLEVHEAPTVSPRSREVLEPGMVITVEPGIYLPGRFGVRIEDMMLITNRGAEVLTESIQKA